MDDIDNVIALGSIARVRIASRDNVTGLRGVEHVTCVHRDMFTRGRTRDMCAS